LEQHGAHSAAYSRIYQSILAQASAAAYIDTFWVLGVGSIVMFFLSFALKKNDLGGGHVVAE
jgi:hypothetical protein